LYPVLTNIRSLEVGLPKWVALPTVFMRLDRSTALDILRTVEELKHKTVPGFLRRSDVKGNESVIIQKRAPVSNDHDETARL
jgi:hypothetical protein